MHKSVLNKPVLVILYGFPGSGKTFFGRQLASELGAAHVSGDQLRYEFFENPTYEKGEDDIIDHLSLYMTSQFLQSDLSVVYDANTSKIPQRRILRDIAFRTHSEVMVAWLQIDIESAFLRVVKRDHRKADDKYSRPLDRTTFENVISKMQNPNLTEDYVVISGKHTFASQKNAVLKKLYERGLVSSSTATDKLVKPELVNRVPNLLGGRVDQSRRNIIIR